MEDDFKQTLLNKFNYDITETYTYNFKNLGIGCKFDISFIAWNKAYSASYIKNNKIKFAPIKTGEDILFTLMALLCTENIYFLDEYLYIYRQRAGSCTKKHSVETDFYIFDNIKLCREFLIERNLFVIMEKDYREFMQRVLFWHYYYIRNDKREEYKAKIKQILTEVEYKDFLKKIKKLRKNNSFFENIFSVKNKNIYGLTYKYITILGFSFSFKYNKKNNCRKQ